MDPISSAILLGIFVGGIILLLFLNSGGLLNPASKMIRNAESSRWTLSEFLHLEGNRPRRTKSFIFREQPIVSVGHRFNGRFDNAILHWEEVPVLDVLIERKFPTRMLPVKPRKEDFFQAGLYTLALLERGVSCSSTRLVVIYCLQENADRCVGSNRTDCLTCSVGVTYTRRFNQRTVLKSLEKLDEVWYRDRKPRAYPDSMKCRACPYSKNRSCKHSAV